MKRLWLDLGEFGHLMGHAGPHEQWHDHGLGLLRTIMHEARQYTDIASTRLCMNWSEVYAALDGYDMLLMNVRSYTFRIARECARIYKELNPQGTVLVGGMHATVDPKGMEDVPYFDHIVSGAGEKVIVDLVESPGSYPRLLSGPPSRSMADWPPIKRTLWPREDLSRASGTWPLEPGCGWGPPPVATIITSRVCPWRCSFCNEASYIPNMERRPVESVIEELNRLDRDHGPLGSVVIHDSMFFQNPQWLHEWLVKYPGMARRRWPYWAAGRADTVRKWPELFEALVRETNWYTVSIGFESGSDRVLQTLNKECTVEDNDFTINLLNRIGDDLVAEGRARPKFWANIMMANPGETREEAIATVRMIRKMKEPLLSLAYYAPYPGSALGYQLIAEGKSLLGEEHNRFPGPKVMGIDYSFYDDLLYTDRYMDRIKEGSWP